MYRDICIRPNGRIRWGPSMTCSRSTASVSPRKRTTERIAAGHKFRSTRNPHEVVRDRQGQFLFLCLRHFRSFISSFFLLIFASLSLSLSLFAIYIANRQCDQNNFGATFWHEDGSIKEVPVVPRLLDIRDCEFYRLDLLNPRERERTRIYEVF